MEVVMMLGDVSTASLNCTLWGGGEFNSACWCLWFPSLCPSDTYQAAVALANPDVYSPIQPPPANPAVGAGTSTLPAPYDCSAGPLSSPNCPGYDAALAASTAQQKTAADTQNTATMQQTAATLHDIAQSQCPGKTLIQNADGSYSCPPGMSLTTMALIAAAGIGAVVLLGGKR